MASKSYSHIGALGLYTASALHCGAESAAGYVDLPVQRERHTDYPVIPGSTLKGVFADEIDDPALFRNRGANGRGATDHFIPDLVSFLDGLIVAFPIRSSDAPFNWVTCPFVLERVFRILGSWGTVEPPAEGRAWAACGGPVLLEELRLVRDPNDTLFGIDGAEAVLRALEDLLPRDEAFAYTRGLFLKRLLVVRDADFKELVTVGTAVTTRIKLTGLGTTTDIPEGQFEDEFTGSERKGNMFVEETVPPETLFVAPLRAPETTAAAFPWEKVPPVVRIGGGETIGHGVTHVTAVKA